MLMPPFRSVVLLLCLLWPVVAETSPGPSAGERLQALVVAEYDPTRSAPPFWPDLSPVGLQWAQEQDQRSLRQLQTISRQQIPAANRMVYDFFAWQGERRLAQFRCRLYLTPFWEDNRFFAHWPGLLGAAEQAWSLPSARSAPEMEQRIRQWEQFPVYLQQVTALLQEAKQRRMLPSQDLVRPLVVMLSNQLRMSAPSHSGSFSLYSGPSLQATGPTMAENRKLQTLNSLEGVTYEERKRLTAAAQTTIHQQVVPSLQKYRDFLAGEYLPACPFSRSLHEWPNGAEVYRELARRYTTTDLTPQQIHALGLQEVARLRAALQTIMAKVGYQASLDEFLTMARTDPRFYYTNQDDLLAAHQSTLTRIQALGPRVIHTVPHTAGGVERGAGPVGAMFQAPDQRSAAGTVLVSLSNPEIHPQFEIVPLMLHEGWPGHALQYAIDEESRVDRAPLLTELQKHAGQHTAFSEGWALYAESLGHEMGLYTDPYAQFGELRMALTRAVRLVVDTGIHGQGWTEDQAKQYLLQQTGKPQEEIDAEVARTLSPGTQLAYTVGQQHFLRLRALATQKLGDRFDLGRFHDVLLRWGPMPLEVLERGVDECLNTPVCVSTLRAPAP